MLRFPWNHHQTLSENIQIHYIELLKHIPNVHNVVVNIWDPIIVLCNGSVYFQRGPDDDSKGIEACHPRSINNILYDCCV